MSAFEDQYTPPPTTGSKSRIQTGKKTGAEGTKSAPASIRWDAMSQADLLAYYQQIRELLPDIELSKLNIENELLLQFHTVKALQASVIDDEHTPANQKAQVANTVASVISKIVDMQLAIYSSERYKLIENLLIRELKKMPEEWAEKFLVSYEKVLRANS